MAAPQIRGAAASVRPTTPALALRPRRVPERDLPAPRRKRRFFSHAALFGAQRLSWLCAVAASGGVGLSLLGLGLGGGATAALLLPLSLPFGALAYGVTSGLLRGRQRRLRHQADVLLCATEERCPEGDARLVRARALATAAFTARGADAMHAVEAGIDYLADALRTPPSFVGEPRPSGTAPLLER